MVENENISLLRRMEEDEARARRRSVLAAWALVGAAVVVLAVMLVAGSNRLAGLRAQTVAERKALQAVSQQRARLADEVADLEGRLAAEYQSQPPESTAVAVDTPSAGQPVPIDTGLATAVDPGRGEDSVPARVYLQIIAPGDRAYARSVGQKLGEAGFRVLGVEYVRNAARPRTTELRYYKRVDEPDALRLLEALRKAGEPRARLVYLGLENNTRVRPRHYEIWFAAGAGEPGTSATGTP